MKPTPFGQLIAFIVAVAAVMAALSVLLPAADAHAHRNDRVKQHPLPVNCWAAHEEVHDGHVYQLCDLYRPTPRPAPSPHAKAQST